MAIVPMIKLLIVNEGAPFIPKYIMGVLFVYIG